MKKSCEQWTFHLVGDILLMATRNSSVKNHRVEPSNLGFSVEKKVSGSPKQQFFGPFSKSPSPHFFPLGFHGR